MSGKIKFHELKEIEQKKYLGDFFSIIASLKNRNEVKCFFKDLLSISEIVMISRRIQIAKKLLNNKTYVEIREEMKVGSNTITQVEKWLNNGFGGYKQVIKKFIKKNGHKKFDILKEAEKTQNGSLGELRKKYPGHFLLLDLFDNDDDD